MLFLFVSAIIYKISFKNTQVNLRTMFNDHFFTAGRQQQVVTDFGNVLNHMDMFTQATAVSSSPPAVNACSITSRLLLELLNTHYIR